MRQIPYRGKQGREHGEWEFLQHAEIPDNILQLAEQNKEAEIAAKIDMTLLNQDNPKNDIRSIIGEEAYFDIWDRIDKRGMFRRGEPTVEFLRKCCDGLYPMREAWWGKPHQSKEDKKYEAIYQMWLKANAKQDKVEATVANYSDLEDMQKQADKVREDMEKRKAEEQKMAEERLKRHKRANKMAIKVAEEQGLDIYAMLMLTNIFEEWLNSKTIHISTDRIIRAVEQIRKRQESAS